LLKRADLNVKCKDDQTILHRVTWGGSKAVVRLLLDHLDDVDTKDKDKRTALYVAAEKGYSLIVKLLLEKRADINARDAHGETELPRMGMRRLVPMFQTQSDGITCRSQGARGGGAAAARDRRRRPGILP